MRQAVLALLIILLLGGILAFQCHECKLVPSVSKVRAFNAEAAMPDTAVESMLGAIDGLISSNGGGDS